MLDRLSVAAALTAGILVAIGIATGGGSGRRPAAEWLARRRRAVSRVEAGLQRLRAPAGNWLRLRIDRAGWSEVSPDRFAVLLLVVAAATAAAGGTAGSLVDAAGAVAGALLGAGAGAAFVLHALLTAVRSRRRRLLAELAPTLELACLELTAGSSATAALTAVTRRTAGELGRELRLVLAGAALASADPLEVRLRRLGERLDLPPLASVAAVIATSRDYGSGVLHGIRAIALDLRRAQRRELIASSRSALTRVLVPAAIGVLLPFMAILLFPAVTSLAANLR